MNVAVAVGAELHQRNRGSGAIVDQKEGKIGASLQGEQVPERVRSRKDPRQMRTRHRC